MLKNIWLMVFEIIAVIIWLVTDSLFLFLNFTYVVLCIALAKILLDRKVKWARMATQLAIGVYVLFLIGVYAGENVMLEGLWYYLFLGVFQGAVIHFLAAKILGPLLFGRGWCGYACWTVMILDFLPYKTRKLPRKNIGYIRYILFVISFLFVAALFVFKIPYKEKLMFQSFIVGNILYYFVGIALAFKLKDNRAFCKYICPVTVFLKPASYYSLIRIETDTEKCDDCGKCKKVCPMDVDMTDNSRKRLNGTECILCRTCVAECPKGAIS
jgi:polyferredoxin